MLSNPRRAWKVLVWSAKKGEASQVPAPCVSLRDLNSLVIHKAQLPAWNQEMLLSNAPHLAATEQTQVCSGLDSRKTQELCHLSPEGRQLVPPHAPQATAEAFKPVPSSAPCLSLPCDKSEPGRDARARARLVLGFSETVS